MGTLERDVRLLPDVLSCSVTGDRVVVMIGPGASRETARLLVARLVERHGDALEVVVIGGAEPLTVVTGGGRTRLAMVGAVAASAVLATASLLGGLGGGQGSEPPRPSPTRRAGIPAAPAPKAEVPAPAAEPEPAGAPRILAGGLRSSGGSRARPVIRIPRDLPAPIDGPVGRPEPVKPPPVSQPPVEPPPTTPPPPPTDPSVEPSSCGGPPDRDAPRERRGRHAGHGPRAWSRSVLVEPHDLCTHGRP